MVVDEIMTLDWWVFSPKAQNVCAASQGGRGVIYEHGLEASV